ncbi:MAG: SLBB domain-containing protein [Acidiferrobacteraceae bacterium]
MVVIGALAVFPAHAASLNPSLGEFHILDQISPAHRREIVRSVQDSVASPGPAFPSARPHRVLLAPGDRLLIHYTSQNRGRAPLSQTLFVLDRHGRLRLPNGTRVSLTGLTEREAAWRLEAEPGFQGVHVVVRRIAPTPVPQPFGLSLFRSASPFVVRDRPLPVGYRLAPGDQLTLTSGGKTPVRYRLTVGPDGVLAVPRIGSWRVAGHRFSQVRAQLDRRLRRHLPNERFTIALTKVHQIRVYVMGDVRRPGAYVLSPFERVTDALFASGGPTRSGSVRAILLKHRGQPERPFDLYSLLLKGDTREDRRLQEGEVVFVPPVGPLVQIRGAVRRPALYELKGPTPLTKLIALAGGLEPNADRERITIARFDSAGRRVLIDAGLDTPNRATLLLRDGDHVRVGRVPWALHGAVRLVGAVVHPEIYPWTRGLRLTDIIPSRAYFQTGADLRYLLILRPHATPRHLFLSADWVRAERHRGGPDDPTLEPGDEITVFSLRGPREAMIARLKRRAEALSGVTHYVPTVTVSGPVRHPGQYPFTSGMTLRVLLAAAGGLIRSPARLNVFVRTADGALASAPAVLNGVTGAGASGVHIAPGDTVRLFGGPRPQAVQVSGWVRQPGWYPVLPGTTVAEAVAAAGGIQAGHPSLTVYLGDPKARKRKVLERTQLVDALRAFAAQNHQAAEETGPVLRFLADPVTRRALIARAAPVAASARVFNGDHLDVEPTPATLAVGGLVAHPRSFVYQPAVTPRDLVVLAGGPVAGADVHGLLIVHDRRVARDTGHWFRNARLRPGDQVLVPPRLTGLPKGLARQLRHWMRQTSSARD